MDKIEKFLKKLSPKEQEMFLLLMLQLQADYTKVPQLKAISGQKKMFRIRVGKYRIIFKVKQAKKVEIIRITKRDDRTYKGL